MVSERTRDNLEAEIADRIARFHEEQQGCRSAQTIARVVGDMVLVRSIGCFTPTETKLAQTEDGRKLVKSARRELRSLTRRQIEGQIADLVGTSVIRSYWDLDVRVGEQVEVYILSASSAN